MSILSSDNTFTHCLQAEHPEFEMTLRSDNGAELVCQAIVDICLAYGIKKREGAPYAPWMQGVVERVQGNQEDVESIYERGEYK